MNPKLKALPIEALFQLRDELVEACQKRRHEALKIGSVAEFESSKHGAIVRIRITGFGPKNVMGEEVDANGFSMRKKWRCHPDFLTPVFPKKVAPPPPKGVGADRPNSPMAGSF